MKKKIFLACFAFCILHDASAQEEFVNTTLKEVAIVASRMKQTASGYVINLRSSDIAKGKQASDVLMFLPGISNESGVYKIHELAVSEIYVEGVKLTNRDELKNIPAEMIRNVEVRHLAGSNQEASQVGGTIHLTLRQPPQGGFYGAVSGETTVQPAYGFSKENIGGVLYARHKNLSLYDNLSLNFNQPEEAAKQIFWNQSKDLYTKTKEETRYRGTNISNRISLIQQISKKNSVGGSYYLSTNKLNTTASTITSNAIPIVISEKEKYLDQGITLKYSSILSAKGTTVDIIGDFFHRTTEHKSDYLHANCTNGTSWDKSPLNMYKLSVDIMTPHNQKLAWKYGMSIQNISSKYIPLSTQTTERFPTSQTASKTYGLTPLVYLQAMGQIWKIRYVAGLNGQINKIGYKEADANLSKDMEWGLNPTLQLMMPLDNKGKHTLMFNYKRTLDPIPYSAISSTIRWSDSHNYTLGNPNLKSPTSDIVLSGISMFQNTLNLTALFAHTKNNIYWETRLQPNSPDVFYTTPVNLPSAYAYGLGTELNFNPAKPWKTKLSGRIEIFPENAMLGGVHYSKSRLRQNYALYNSFFFRHGWGGLLNIILEPTYSSYDRTYHAVYNISGQVYKKMCKEKLQLTLSFNPLGNRRKYDRNVNGNRITYDYTTSVQSIGISFVWNFSGGKQVNVSTLEGNQAHKEIRDIR